MAASEFPAVPDGVVDQRFQRQIVADPTGEAPGTIVVDPNTFYLHLVGNDGTSIRYGIGVGREGFSWSGTYKNQYKRRWPKWKPPNEMVARQPELERYSIANGGMQGGPENPLGARALISSRPRLEVSREDTLYRIHGNPDPRSIGRAVSSGCIRMLNQDVIDLFDRVPSRAPVVGVLQVCRPHSPESDHNSTRRTQMKLANLALSTAFASATLLVSALIGTMNHAHAAAPHKHSELMQVTKTPSCRLLCGIDCPAREHRFTARCHRHERLREDEDSTPKCLRSCRRVIPPVSVATWSKAMSHSKRSTSCWKKSPMPWAMPYSKCRWVPRYGHEPEGGLTKSTPPGRERAKARSLLHCRSAGQLSHAPCLDHCDPGGSAGRLERPVWLRTSPRKTTVSCLVLDDTVVVALGRTVYGENLCCVPRCRIKGQSDWEQPGSDGLMLAPPHHETGDTWHHKDALLFALTKNGVTSMLGPNSTYKSAMPAYAGILSDEEIVAALSYSNLAGRMTCASATTS